MGGETDKATGLLLLDVATKVQKSTFLRQYIDELLSLLKCVVHGT
jgi:hypothetical protein